MTRARVVATAVSDGGRKDLEDLFPARWNPRRPLHPSLRPLMAAVAEATEAAGWWSPGSGEHVEGGLVVAVDLHGCGPALDFWSQVQSGATLRPSAFLHSLPSTPAATLGLLFGLTEYQLTVTHHGAGGFLAASHARDLLLSGRRKRVVVGALSGVSASLAERFVGAGHASDPHPFQLGVAWCLEAADRDPARGEAHLPAAAAPTTRDTADLLPELSVGYRVLAAPALLAAGRVLEASGATTLVHRDPCGGDATLTVARERGD